MRKYALMILAVVMVFSLASTADAAGTYSDMPTGLSHNAMQAAVDNGLMTGNEKGQLLPRGAVTRAQAATMMVNAFGGTAKADLSKFSDVKTGDWFYEKMAVAVNMGIIAGTGSKLEPNKNLTREQAAVVISRAIWLLDKSADLSKFTDSSNVSDWAKDGVGAMVRAGYMVGAGNKLNPKASITREEFAQILYSVATKYIYQTGTYKDSVEGNLVVRGTDVTLDGATIKGDLIVGDGAGESTITVKNTTIGGRVVVRGGGVHSVVFTNTKLGTVVVARADGAVRLSTDVASTPKEVYAERGNQKIILSGSLSSVIVETTTPVVFDNAKVESVMVVAPKADITVSDNTTVKAVTMTQAATGAEVSVETNSTVGTVTTDASDSTVAVDKTSTVNAVTADGSGEKVTGEGTVNKVTASALAANTTVSTPNTVVVNNSSTPVETNNGTIPSGYTGTTNQKGEIGAVKPITYYNLTITLKDNSGEVNDMTAYTSNKYLDGSTSFFAETAGLYDINKKTLQDAYDDQEAYEMAEAAYKDYGSKESWDAFSSTYSNKITGFDTFSNYNVAFEDLVGTHMLTYSNTGHSYTVTVTIAPID